VHTKTKTLASAG